MPHRFQRNLQLQKKDFAIGQRVQRRVHPRNVAFRVRARNGNDAVFARIGHPDIGNAGGCAGLHAHGIGIHALGREMRKVVPAEQVIAHLAGHARFRPQTGQRNRLIRALAAEFRLEKRSYNGLARRGKARRAHHQIHVDRADHGAFFHFTASSSV